MCCYAIVNVYLFIKLVDVVRHHCSAGVILLWLAVKCCSSIFNFFNVTYPSLYSGPTHIHSNFTISFHHSCVGDSKLKG